MTNQDYEVKLNKYRHIDAGLYLGVGFGIVATSTALTLISFGVSSPITLVTTSFGLGLIGGLASTLIPINCTKYNDDESKPYNDVKSKPLPSPSKTFFEMFINKTSHQKS